MLPEPPDQSPLASPHSPAAETPLSDRPEPPRLGILHLIVLTVRVTSWRWRLFWLAIPAAKGAAVPVVYLLSRSAVLGKGWQWRMECLLPHLLVAAALIVVVLKDLSQRKCHPWTHWFGLGTWLWLEAAAVAFLWIAFR